MMTSISVRKSDSASRGKKPNLFNPAIFALIADVGLNFFRFLKSHGFSGEQKLVVLSSKGNYSCSENELKDVRIIINLKRLNLIKHLDLFLNALVRILPPNTSFIGYFFDERTMDRYGFKPGNLWCILNWFHSLLGSRTNHLMNKSEVTELLEKNGFKTLNMKEMNGFTYFISQNVGMPL